MAGFSINEVQNVKANIREKLPYEIKTIALNFIDILAEYGVTFYKDNSYCWINQSYYWCKYNDNCVCFISIKDPDEPQNLWTVWSDDIKSEWLENYDADDNIRELAWMHIDHCGHCGSCDGGRRKVVFGREFKAVCGCTFRVDNPNAEDLHFLTEMIKIKISSLTQV